MDPYPLLVRPNQSTISTAAQVHSSPTASSSSTASTSEETTTGGSGEGEAAAATDCPLMCPTSAPESAVPAGCPKFETECAKQFLHEMIRNHKY